MAFTTQRDYLKYAGGENCRFPPQMKRSDGALMTYRSCFDARAWSIHGKKRSQFYVDLVHKTSMGRKLFPLPNDVDDLSREILLLTSQDELIAYALRLQDNIKQKKDQIGTLEDTKSDLEGKLHAVQDENRELTEQMKRSEQTDQLDQDELERLGQLLEELKRKAENFDELLTENECLRNQLDNQSEPCGAMDMAQHSFLKMKSKNCEKMEMELVIYKGEYECMKQKNQDLAGELQRALSCVAAHTELKRALSQEVCRRKHCEEQIEELLHMYEDLDQELARKNSYIRLYKEQQLGNMQEVESDLQKSQDQLLEVIEESIREQTPAVCKECETNRQEVARLKDKIALLERSATASSGDVALRLRESDKLVEDMVAKEKSMQQQMLLLEKQLQERLAELKQSEQVNEQLRQQDAECREKVAGMQVQLKQAMLASASTDSAMQQQFVDQMQRLEDENAKLKASISEYQSRIQNMEGDLRKMAEVRQSVPVVTAPPVTPVLTAPPVATVDNSKILEVQAQLDAARQAASDKDTTISELQATIEKLKAAATDSSGLFEEGQRLEAENSKLGDKIKELEQELENSRQLAAKFESDALQSLLPGPTPVPTTVPIPDAIPVPTPVPTPLPTDSSDCDALQAELTERNKTIERLNSEIGKLKEAAAGADKLEKELQTMRERMVECEEARERQIPNEPPKESEEPVEPPPEPRISITLTDKTTSVSIFDEYGSNEMEKAPEPEISVDEQPKSEKLSLISQVPVAPSPPTDPCVVRAIALKLAQNGIELLLVGELNVLHREVCGAITRKNAIIGQNVLVMADTMSDCLKVITDARLMMNRETLGSQGRPSMVPPARGSLASVNRESLGSDALRHSLAMSHRESFAAAARQSMAAVNARQSMVAFQRNSTVLPGKRSSKSLKPQDSQQDIGLRSNESQPRIRPARNGKGKHRVDERVLFGSNILSRNAGRKWRAENVEMAVATTLADGSRVVARQKFVR